MSSKLPLVTIVTINNNSERTLDFIESVKRLSYPNIECIVVDNASSDDDLNKLRHNKDSYLLIENRKLQSFAQAVNTSIRFSKGKYILFAGNDCVLAPATIEPLVESLEGNQAIGAVSPKVKLLENPQEVYYAGFTEMHKITMQHKMIGRHKEDSAEFDKACFTSFPYPGAMMIPRSVIDRTCMMPEVYEHFFESFDWVTQIKKAGYNIYFQPKSLVYKQTRLHKDNSPARLYYLTRSKMLYTLRNRSGINLIASLAFHIFIFTPQLAFKLILNKKTSFVKAYAKGLLWSIKHVFDRNLYYNQLS